jgi:uncharacterized protein YggE
MRIGGVMKVLTFAVVAVLAVLAAGCSSKEDGTEGTLGQGRADVAVVGEPGQGTAAQISYQPGGGVSGTLPGITVVGSGTARAVPDVADWSFGVQSDAETASAALKAASEATRRIIGALRDEGIAKEDLRTEQVSLYPRTTDDGRAVIGYSASSTVHATVRDLGKAGSIVDAAVEAGANQIYGPSLRVSDNRAQYRAAIEAALDDAHARAQALAAKAGVTLGGPVAIVESGGGTPGPVYDRGMAQAGGAEVPIEPGVDEIAATLTVTYAIS